MYIFAALKTIFVFHIIVILYFSKLYINCYYFEMFQYDLNEYNNGNTLDLS